MAQVGDLPTSSAIPSQTRLSVPQMAALVLLRFLAVGLVVAAILFLPAGTVRWWQGWALLSTFLTTALSAFFYFLKTDPELAERRLHGKEQVRAQKWILPLGIVVFAGILTLPGFDRRLGWSEHWLGAEPVALEVLSLVMMLGAMLGVAWVARTNRYAGRTIRVEEGQTVIASGPYRLVRHPMYAFSLVIWISVPLALGSYIVLPALALSFLFYVPRILNEEKLLRAELPGYTEYCQKTRWRMVPGVW
jgi:protein-S-isoprenylcysteine O-methyltransferase Ste14